MSELTTETQAKPSCLKEQFCPLMFLGLITERCAGRTAEGPAVRNISRSPEKEESLARGGELCRMEGTKTRRSTWRETRGGRIPVGCSNKEKFPVVFN